MKKTSFILIALLVALAACKNQESKTTETTNENTLNGKISVSGAFALYPLAVKWGEEFQKVNPGVTIDIQGGGSGKGMTDVLSNTVDLAMISKSISDEEKDKGAYGIGVVKDAVVPTINANNPYAKDLLARGLTKEEFADIFLNEKMTSWAKLLGKGSGEKIAVFTRSDACGAADAWAKYIGDKKQEDLKGTGVNGDPGVAEAVANSKNAIGYNNVGFAYDVSTRKPNEGILPLPIDVNANGKIDAEENFYSTVDDLNKAILSGAYPSPPARQLYFATNGKPENKLVIAFLNWVLTDGQKFVEEAGYVKLPQSTIDEQKKLVQ